MTAITLDTLRAYPRAKARICNGVGPKGYNWLFPRAFKPNQLFHRAADLHDLLYWTGGGPHAKVIADCRFLAAMLGVCCQGHLFWIPSAFMYFGAVLVGGWLSFHYGRKRSYGALRELEDYHEAPL